MEMLSTKEHKKVRNEMNIIGVERIVRTFGFKRSFVGQIRRNNFCEFNFNLLEHVITTKKYKQMLRDSTRITDNQKSILKQAIVNHFKMSLNEIGIMLKGNKMYIHGKFVSGKKNMTRTQVKGLIKEIKNA